MSIGLCCQYLEFEKNNSSGEPVYKNIMSESNLQYGQYCKGKYNTNKIESTWISNINNLFSAIKRINSEGFKVFRFSSTLFPLYESEQNLLNNSLEIKNILCQIGKYVKDNNIRITTHPDQFVVISSNKQDVINKSIKMLEHHAWIMDNMELPESQFYCINIHGGTKGNSNILIDSIKKLPKNVKSRLTLENDEKCYNVKDLFEVYEQTGTPIVFDSHHHSFNDNKMSSYDGFLLSKKTWGEIKPLTHLSNTTPGLENAVFNKKRQHSDYVHYIPEWQKEQNNINLIDIDFEFKMKNLAILKAINDFNIIL
jgi:UV DNA damage endonuclease